MDALAVVLGLVDVQRPVPERELAGDLSATPSRSRRRSPWRRSRRRGASFAVPPHAARSPDRPRPAAPIPAYPRNRRRDIRGCINPRSSGRSRSSRSGIAVHPPLPGVPRRPGRPAFAGRFAEVQATVEESACGKGGVVDHGRGPVRGSRRPNVIKATARVLAAPRRIRDRERGLDRDLGRRRRRLLLARLDPRRLGDRPGVPRMERVHREADPRRRDPAGDGAAPPRSSTRAADRARRARARGRPRDPPHARRHRPTTRTSFGGGTSRTSPNGGPPTTIRRR